MTAEELPPHWQLPYAATGALRALEDRSAERLEEGEAETADFGPAPALPGSGEQTGERLRTLALRGERIVVATDQASRLVEVLGTEATVTGPVELTSDLEVGINPTVETTVLGTKIEFGPKFSKFFEVGIGREGFTVKSGTTVTAGTVVDQRQTLAGFYADVTGLSRTLRTFLDRNGDDLVDAGRLARPVLAMLARYAPSYPCVLKGLRVSAAALDTAFRDGKLHSYATLGLQLPAYGRQDAPRWTTANGPSCAGLPTVGGFRMPEFVDGGSHPRGSVVAP